MHSSVEKRKAFAALVLLSLLAGCGDQATSANAPVARPVQVQRVAFAREETGREFAGVVRARYESDLGFRVAGKITARIVNVGDRVNAGDVIARLDPQDLKLQVASAQAELSAATSNLAQAAADELRYGTLKSRGYATVADYERRPRRTKPTGASNARSERLILRAISSPTPSSRRTPTA
jgi:multidrug efflux pump subunit AcrA (membrane-fusion protein)